LTRAEVEKSRAEHGSNRLAEIRGQSLLGFLREALGDRTLRILIACAALVLAVDVLGGGRYVDGIAILVAVAAAALVTASNEWRAQSEFKSLQVEREALRVRVVREGATEAVSAFDLVVGDVVELEAGDKVPADGTLLSGFDLQVDESLLSGESAAVAKEAGGASDLRAGTLVADGRGLMQVTLVGEQTEYGRLRAQLAMDEDPTPLQERLGHLADRIGLFGLAAAVLVFLAQAGTALARGHVGFDLGTAREMLSYAVLAVTIVVVAVPEGLPVAVTLSLAYSVMRMARDKSLVRRLMACETMGAADVVCVDKTGTLTENRMTVRRALFPDVRSPADALPDPSDVHRPLLEAFAQIAAVDSTAHLEHGPGRTTSYLGNATEGALLALLEEWGFLYRDLRRQAQTVAAQGFTSDRKSMSTTVRRPGGTRELVKGAPEAVLARCRRALSHDGVPRELPEPERAAIRATVDGWAEQALRPLALAYRDLPAEAGAGAEADGAPKPERDAELVLVAVVGIGDPVRAAVPDAIRACEAAGVQVKVVTGDNKLTALAVARQVGVMKDGDLAMEGAELRALSDDAVRELLPRLRLVARAVPSDKLRLVSLLKSQGHVVAVTGDGTNDGPALRHADVGLAMGLSGTDVAREASDIVILDDNFASVVSTIRWGRAVFENIRKFLQFQLTVNLVALVTAFAAAVTGRGTPLNVVQLLWVNLIMDTLAALALSLEPPAKDLSGTTPHGRTTPLLSRWMGTHILGLGALMVAATLLALYTDLFVPRGAPEHFTFVFNLFVFLQVGNLMNCRSTRPERGAFAGLGRSRLFLAIFAFVVVVQALIVELGGGFFHTVPLTGTQWLLSIAAGGSMLGAGALLRAAGRSSLGARLGRLGASAALRAASLAARARPWLDRPAAEGPLGLLAGVGGVCMLGGLAAKSLGPGWAPPAFATFSAGIALCGCWAWEKRLLLRRHGPAATRLHIAASTLLALALLAQVNYLASRHWARADLTAAKSFTLSPQTVAVVRGLAHPVRLTTLFRETPYAAELKDLLAAYAAAGGAIQVEHVDPDRDPGALERLGDRAGLKSLRLSSVVVEYLDRSRVLTAGDLWSRPVEYQGGQRVEVPGARPVFRGEEALTSALAALASDAPQRICFAVGHGEKSPDEFAGEGYALARDRLKREGYQVEAVALVDGAPVPPRCQVLVQPGPRSRASPQDVSALDAYLGAGGKWLVMVDPWQNAGLDELLKSWGVGLRSGYLTDPKSSVAGVGEDTLVAGLYQDHPVTSSLLGVPLVFPYASAVYRVEGRRRLEGAELVLTSDRAVARLDRRGSPDAEPLPKASGARYAVAVAVDEPVDYYAADGRREPSRIVAVGNSAFAANRHLARAGNADFFLNAVDWLARRDSLVALRARPAEERRVSLSTGAQSALYWATLGLLPALVGLLGAAVAWKRRR
jgi:calcium-translocating P-type ATPase